MSLFTISVSGCVYGVFLAIHFRMATFEFILDRVMGLLTIYIPFSLFAVLHAIYLKFGVYLTRTKMQRNSVTWFLMGDREWVTRKKYCKISISNFVNAMIECPIRIAVLSCALSGYHTGFLLRCIPSQVKTQDAGWIASGGSTQWLIHEV